MTIIGLDPGTQRYGFGCIRYDGGQPKLNDQEYEAYGVIKLSSGIKAPQRIANAALMLDAVFEAHLPDYVAIEIPFLDPRKGAQVPIKLGMAVGLALSAAGRIAARVETYEPATVKAAVTGNGRASKAAINAMVSRILSIEETVPEDSADALAVALCGAWRVEREKRTKTLF